MGSKDVGVNFLPKPQFNNGAGLGKSTTKLLPTPFSETFQSSFVPPRSNPSGSLPWFHSEKPVFRQRSEPAPVKTVWSSQKPWMTGEILFEIRKKHSLLQKAKNEDTAVAWNDFKQQRILVSRILRDAKLKHEIGLVLVPKDKTFFCDSCDRGFANETELKNHLAEHICCSVDGCSFRAHTKVVAIHRRMQHDTGLAKRIVSLDTPDDIRKWREERKRNFPTAENVERRKKEAEEQKSRGELLDTKYFGKMKGYSSHRQHRSQHTDDSRSQLSGRGQRGRGRRRRSRRGRGRGNASHEQVERDTLPFKRPNPSLVESLEDNPEDDTNGKLKRFKGTATDYETCELITQTQAALQLAVDRALTSQCTRKNRRNRSRRMERQRTDSHVDLENDRLETNNSSGENASLRNAATSEPANNETECLVIPSSHGMKNGEEIKNLQLENPREKLSDAVEAAISNSASEAVGEAVNAESDSVIKLAQEDSELEEGEIVDSDEERKTVDNTSSNSSNKSILPAQNAHNHAENTTRIPSFFAVNEEEDSDEAMEIPVKPHLPDSQPMKMAGALGSLIATYGEDSESEGELKGDASENARVSNTRQNSTNIVRRKPVPDMYPISRRRVTLLEKLLQKEIRKERNTILQCVHYIVKNDFFKVHRHFK